MPIFGECGVRLGMLAGVFLPSLLLKLNSSSMAAGLYLAACLILLATILVFSVRSPKLSFQFSIVLWSLLVISLILVHLFLSGFFVALPQDLIRAIGSLIGLLLMSAAAYVLASSLVELDQAGVKRVLLFTFMIFIVNCIFSITGIDFLGSGSVKPTFLFSEPSHFSLVIAPFFIYFLKKRPRGWVYILFLFLLWAGVVQNLTMILVILLSLVVTLQKRVLVLLLPVLTILFLSFADVDYFIKRMLFLSEDGGGNLSSLILLQGWENAFLSLRDTMGLGVGFQQFGIASSTGAITDQVILLHGGVLNMFDGASTAPKLLGEFGFMGVAVLTIFVVRAIRSIVVLRRNNEMHELFLFARCVEIGFLIELFVRGVGYFSSGIFLYLVIFFCEKLKCMDHGFDWNRQFQKNHIRGGA